MIPVLRQIAQSALNGVLPYPDLPRRIRVRRRAFKFVTCKRWPGDAATGDDAAQLALLRLLWLQRLIRRAVRARRTEEAALLARSTVDTCITGLYCLHSETAVGALTAANNSAARRVLGYFAKADLLSQEAIDAGARAMGDLGPNPNLKKWAEWLEKEKDLDIAANLYVAYYVPLSHFFAHASAFALMRHVRADDTLRKRPAFPWSRRSAARLGDGCAGLMAAAIAGKRAEPTGLLVKYAEAHFSRMLTPAFTMASKGLLRSFDWRKTPSALKTIRDIRQYTGGPGLRDTPAQREATVRGGFTKAMGSLGLDAEEKMFRPALDEFVAQVLADMHSRAGSPSPGTGADGS